MPEGSDVFRFTRSLSKKIKNKHLNFKVLSGKYLNSPDYKFFRKCAMDFKDVKCEDVYKKGKHTFIILSNGYGIHVRYGLKGHWSETPETYSKFQITSDESVYFTDSINYGDLEFMKKEEITDVVDSLGPDVMNITWEDFETTVSFYNGNKSVADVIVDQTIISGIGNFMRSEILYDAKINPLRKFTELSTPELKKLHASILKISQEAINPEYTCKIYKNKTTSSQKLKNGYVWWDPEVQK